MKLKGVLERHDGRLVTTPPGRPVQEVIRLMNQHRVGAVLVLEEDVLRGIITERDILRALDGGKIDIDRTPVEELMSTDLVTCSEEDTLDTAMAAMSHNRTGARIRHLPILRDEHVVGVVSIGDIVATLLTETRFENKLLKHYIKNWPEEEES